jgi:Effector-associated domain 11
MNTNDFSKTMSSLIAKDELEQAITMLSKLLHNSPKLDEVILQSGRLSDIKKQIRLGVVNFNEANVERNRIRAALLSFVGEIEETMEDHPSIKREVEQIPEAKILVKNIQKHSGTGDNNQYIGGTVHGNNYGHTIQGQGNQFVDVGLDRAVDAMGKEVSKATSTTINLAVKILVVAAILLSVLGYFWYQNEQKIEKESEIQIYNLAVSRLKNDIVNLKTNYPNSPIQTLSDFDNFKIDNFVEAERRKEYTVSFTNSKVSNGSFSGKMILTYVCGHNDIFFKDFNLLEFKDISTKTIFREKQKQENPNSTINNLSENQQDVSNLVRPANQSAELLKLMSGLETNYVGIITNKTGLNIRDAQSVTNGKVLTTIPYNSLVLIKKLGQTDVINGNSNYWCWAEYNGVEGWIWMFWVD